MQDIMAEDTNSNTSCIGRVIYTLTTPGLITRTYMPPTHCQTSTFQTPLWLDDLQYKETIKIPQMNSYPHFTLATYTYYYRPSLKRLFQAFSSDPISQFFQACIPQTDPLECILALSALAMSCSSSPIFIPSRLSSPANSAGNTPYVITSPPPDSPTNDKLTLPHKQMIEHIAHLLNIEEEEVCHQFPTVCSLLPIDRSPPTLSYPRTEFEQYNDPTFPNSPPIPSPKPLPVSPPHFHDSMSITPPVTSAANSSYNSLVETAFIESIPSCSPSPISPMAMVLYQQAKTQSIELKAMDTDAEGQTPSSNGPQPGVLPGPGWKDNFTKTGTCHFFVIPDGEEDVIIPFISYNLHATFPELLATNGHGCTVHSCCSNQQWG